ncbi:MAG: substrate-binding domain-containing protein, partial [Euzebyaceae bacterium]|nr:substrate-binding domain-containing protein [Euzebyaceae bacterium]
MGRLPSGERTCRHERRGPQRCPRHVTNDGDRRAAGRQSSKAFGLRYTAARDLVGLIVGSHADTSPDHEPYHRRVDDGMPVAFVNGDVDGLDASFISPDESAAGGERRAAPGEPRERPPLLPGGTTAAPAGDHGGADRQDLRALGAVRAARERGLDVPGDVSVVGYDDTP